MSLVDLSHRGDAGPATRLSVGEDPGVGGLRLERCADLPAVVVDVGWRAIGPEAFVGLGDLTGTAVLLLTGWDRHWGTPAYTGPTHPYLTPDGARHLVAAGVVLVGTDSVDVDDTSPAAAPGRPTRTLLLDAGLVVLEHLCDLELLPDTGALLSAVPPRSAGTSWPVRASAST